jgi:MFS family permease
MIKMSLKKYYPTALALYFTYIILGIEVSVLSQYKQEFAGAWGVTKTLANGHLDVSLVLAAIAALGLGRLIMLPFSGPFSDRFGRKSAGLVGCALFAVYFLGIAWAPNFYLAYIFAIIGGMANSFMDVCVAPSCIEIFPKSGEVASMFMKFSVAVGQFMLPFMIGFVATNHLSYKIIFYVVALLIIIDAVLLSFMKFPPKNADVVGIGGGDEQAPAKKEKMKFSATSIAIICLGFTVTSTFQLWLNCNQELGALYGLARPSTIQSFYSLGIITAILVTSVLVKKVLEPVRILFIYPMIAVATLVITYFVQTPAMCLIAGFMLGYSGAGGVLQIGVATANKMFPANKGKITSIFMISSSLANYLVINAAGAITSVGGTNGPRYVLLFNAAITAAGVLLALFINMQFNKSRAADGKMSEVA